MVIFNSRKEPSENINTARLLRPNMSTKTVVLITFTALMHAHQLDGKSLRDRDEWTYRSRSGELVEVNRHAVTRDVSMFGQPGCECKCRQKWSEDEWQCCGCEMTENACFPAIADVILANGNVINMDDIRIGDSVKTVHEGDIVPSVVTAFLHLQPDVIAIYRRLSTTSGRHILLSRSHILFASTDNTTTLPEMETRFASDVSIGDYVITEVGGLPSVDQIISIDEELHQGAYVPLTAHGTLLVNGVLASCYASFNHQMAHAALSPLRWFPTLVPQQDWADGVHPYVSALKTIGRTLLPSIYVYSKSNSDTKELPTVLTADVCMKNVCDVEL